jgi:hypothetical protein
MRQRQLLHARQIPAQDTAGMTVFYFLINSLAVIPEISRR